MARPSRNVDKRMLEVAKRIVCERGCSGIRVREIAAKAHANLGMFHYHFKSKRKFTRLLLQEYYDEFFRRLSTAAGDGNSAIEQVRGVLLAAALFVRQEHHFYAALLKDILNGNDEVLKFVRENFPKHIRLMRELILRAQKEGDMVDMPFPQLISFLMTSLNFPTLIALTVADRSGEVKRRELKMRLDDVASHAAIEQRLDMALKGVSP